MEAKNVTPALLTSLTTQHKHSIAASQKLKEKMEKMVENNTTRKLTTSVKN